MFICSSKKGRKKKSSSLTLVGCISLSILSFYFMDFFSWVHQPLDVSWHTQQSAWKHTNVSHLAWTLDKMMPRCWTMQRPVLMMRSLSPTDVRSSENREYSWVLSLWLDGWWWLWWRRRGSSGGAESHSPLKLGRLFSLNAAKPSSRSLVGITFERKWSESLMSSKRLGRLTQKMWLTKNV